MTTLNNFSVNRTVDSVLLDAEGSTPSNFTPTEISPVGDVLPDTSSEAFIPSLLSKTEEPLSYNDLSTQQLAIEDTCKRRIRAGVRSLPLYIEFYDSNGKVEKEFHYGNAGWVQFRDVMPTEKDVEDRLFIKSGRYVYPANCCYTLMGDGIFALDFDYDSAKTWAKWKASVLSEYPNALDNVYVETTRKGRHLYFYCPELVLTKDDRKLAMRPSMSIKGGQVLVEIRIQGDSCVSAPSLGYTPESGDLTKIRTTPTSLEVAQRFLSVARSFDERPPEEPKAVKKARKRVYSKQSNALVSTTACDTSTPGGAFNKAATMDFVTDMLEDCDWLYDKEDDEGRRLFWHPDKERGSQSGNLWQDPDDEDAPVLFYVFTTSTDFEAEQAYTPFAVYAILYCDGDFSEAARQLYNLGYGVRKHQGAYQPPTLDIPSVITAKATTMVTRLLKDKDKAAVIEDVLPNSTKPAALQLTKIWMTIPEEVDRVAVLAPFLLGYGVVDKEDACRLLRTLFSISEAISDEFIMKSLNLFDTPDRGDYPVNYLLNHRQVGKLWFKIGSSGRVPVDKSSLGVICDFDPDLKTLMYDEFVESIVLKEPLESFENRTGELRAADLSQMARSINDVYGLNFRTTDVLDGLRAATNFRSRRFNTIVELLENLPPWDGINRRDSFLQKYLLAKDTPLNREMFKRWLYGAIATAYCPGTEFSQILIFSGSQGIGKSLTLKKLAMNYFSDSVSVSDLANDKLLYEKTRGAWICEVAELAGFRKTEQNSLKRAISSPKATFREPFAVKSEVHYRHFVLAGTTNEKQFLLDVTGGRRYWVIECEQAFNVCPLWHEVNDEMIKQIWAQSLFEYRNGDNSLVLPEDLLEESRRLQDELMEVPHLASVVAKYVGECYAPSGCANTTPGHIDTAVPNWIHCFDKADIDAIREHIFKDKAPAARDKREIREALTYLGWQNESRYNKLTKRTERAFWRPEADFEPLEIITAQTCPSALAHYYAVKYLP